MRPLHTSAQLTRKCLQHQDEEHWVKDRALMHIKSHAKLTVLTVDPYTILCNEVHSLDDTHSPFLSPARLLKAHHRTFLSKVDEAKLKQVVSSDGEDPFNSLSVWCLHFCCWPSWYGRTVFSELAVETRVSDLIFARAKLPPGFASRGLTISFRSRLKGCSVQSGNSSCIYMYEIPKKYAGRTFLFIHWKPILRNIFRSHTF